MRWRNSYVIYLYTHTDTHGQGGLYKSCWLEENGGWVGRISCKIVLLPRSSSPFSPPQWWPPSFRAKELGGVGKIRIRNIFLFSLSPECVCVCVCTAQQLASSCDCGSFVRSFVGSLLAAFHLVACEFQLRPREKWSPPQPNGKCRAAQRERENVIIIIIARPTGDV